MLFTRVFSSSSAKDDFHVLSGFCPLQTGRTKRLPYPVLEGYKKGVCKRVLPHVAKITVGQISM